MGKDLRWRWSYLVHPAVALGITGAVVAGLALAGLPTWLAFGMVPIAAGVGLVREKIQHAWEELTPHQLVEAWGFPAGALVAALIGLAF